jgi:hypothetical protein
METRIVSVVNIGGDTFAFTEEGKVFKIEINGLDWWRVTYLWQIDFSGEYRPGETLKAEAFHGSMG